ncbi:heat-inducible transcriptional repressor HrcA [Thermovirga sp.]|uniref:heat-inducible transcriptional repressor HrcA n=1 Tax=Thermovirga sp. TaxID=2699834 RepID=UPI0025E0280D|nr:heat-inducible transcriptional repressor HrcA [Thermovirga sp.]MBO8153453.1 heat-inducible transcription repressor HrcA [Thermovirga sp.]
MLTERQLEIVLAVVYEYIKTGEPVGSRTIAKRYLRGRSAATIRNEMADLEEMDFLYQPHTSAGRLPTPKAFRVYVDAILRRQRSPGDEYQYWVRELKKKRDDLESALRYATKLLGDLTNCIGVAAVGPAEEAVLQKVEFVKVAERTALLIVILKGGLLHHKTMQLPQDMDQQTLDELSQRITVVASGKSWRKVRDALLKYVMQGLQSYAENCKAALNEVDILLLKDSYHLFTGGKHNILSLPDFADLSRLQVVMALLEEESSIAELVQKFSPDKGLSVMIGKEDPAFPIEDCSVIMASNIADGKKTVLGLIGPVRMDYERSISVLEAVLDSISTDVEEEVDDI